MIVITDGESHDSPHLVQAVTDSERDNITMYAIAVSLSHFIFCSRYTPYQSVAVHCLWTFKLVTTVLSLVLLFQVLGYYNRRGINPEAFLKEIKFIASDPDEKHFFNVTDESALKDIVDALGERIFSLEGQLNFILLKHI